MNRALFSLNSEFAEFSPEHRYADLPSGASTLHGRELRVHVNS
jgi:hypothetical protein